MASKDGHRSAENYVPKGWKRVRLGDVAEIAFSGVDKKTVDGEIPVELCNYTDVFYSRRIHAGMVFMAATATPVEHRRWTLRAGDVLFTKDSETPDEIGIPSYVTEDMPHVLCGYHLALARPRPNVVDGAFLAEALGSNVSKREFARVANGVTRFGLTLGATAALPILLPPLPEQRAIAAVLDSIDEAIERTEAVIAATEQLRDSLLHELLTRGVPGWHTEWKDVPGLGTIPADWDVVRLGDVAEVRSGQSDPRKPIFQNSMFIAPDDIESATGKLLRKRTVADARAISGKYEFDERDVVYSKIRPYLMKVYLPKGAGLCSADMYPLRTKSGLLRHYLAFALLSREFTAYARTCSDRTGIPKINRDDLLKYRLPLPRREEQHSIADTIESADEAITQADEARKRLQELKASAADALLTGRVRTLEDRAVENG